MELFELFLARRKLPGNSFFSENRKVTRLDLPGCS